MKKTTKIDQLAVAQNRLTNILHSFETDELMEFIFADLQNDISSIDEEIKRGYEDWWSKNEFKKKEKDKKIKTKALHL